uniref:uroporphyrinogen-III C-methyltransferase n=1 Tax=Odontella aurita TaxID=265563 RepID=A0A7S4JPE8_9STRA
MATSIGTSASTQGLGFITTTQKKRRFLRRPLVLHEASPSSSSSEVKTQIERLISSLGGNSDDSDDGDDDDATISKVHIIGTGLSDRASSLPLRTLSVLSRADVVLHDALSLPESQIRLVVPDGCIVRSVGKRGDDRPNSVPQSDIDALLLRYAADDAFRTVVRLKGGDPFLFGRTRTEVDALRDGGAAYEVTPGLSSCIAGPHYGGVPLTDPVVGAQSFSVFSGTDARGRGAGRAADDNDSSDGGRMIDWSSLDVDSLVFLMIGRLDKLEELCGSIGGERGGYRWHGDTPCAVVRSAGRPLEQRVWRATLSTLVGTIRNDLGEAAVSISPAVLVVGPTASLDLLSQT